MVLRRGGGLRSKELRFGDSLRGEEPTVVCSELDVTGLSASRRERTLRRQAVSSTKSRGKIASHLRRRR
jgi:hypothetical protein